MQPSVLSVCSHLVVHQKGFPDRRLHEAEQELTMIVGTYTSGDSKGLYSFRFNEENGTATALSEAEVENPSYLVPSADGKFIYAVSEFSNEQAAANAFAFNKDGRNFPTAEYAEKPEAKILATSLPTEVMWLLPITAEEAFLSSRSIRTGSLLPASEVVKFKGSGADKERQEKPHLHCVRITPDGKYLFADDLGTDQIHKFIVNPNAKADNEDVFLKEGSPASYKVEAGSGPRHLTFAPNGSYAYLINELSGTVIAFEYSDGELKEIQTIAADTVGAKGSGDIHISPDGKFLYASNRLKADGLAIFSIHPENGMLTKVGYQLTGIHPRNFIITPNGKYLLVACRDSNVIQIYERDTDTGLLTDIRKDIKVDKPVCIKFVP